MLLSIREHGPATIGTLASFNGSAAERGTAYKIGLLAFLKETNRKRKKRVCYCIGEDATLTNTKGTRGRVKPTTGVTLCDEPRRGHRRRREARSSSSLTLVALL